MNILPAITLYQPWATWIIRAWKTIETRTHNRFSSLVNQTILIHAGMTTDGSDYTIHNPYLTREQIMHNPDEMLNGCILGSAHVHRFQLLEGKHSKDALINCHITQRWGLFLKDIHKFETPIPVKGEMGIWYFDMDKKEKVKKPTKQTILF